ncbi:protein kinase [Sphingomonas sp. Leaf67]|uniref:serine/threonine protein kinase n=1 Tax=Sphingomonas sp. Leaf67 TaxID=1736230 RepID=UPI0006F2ECEF|nr:protein kinase [Sphingomonas sp. Leaf67]KQN88861.1 protein kinase [Sphingomonas sp. Leaf67]
MSDENAQTWIDAARWRERWSVVENLVGGGQGDAFRARRTADGRNGFLKVLKARTVPERRSRFFREASAYDSFAVDGIPRLIESNAHRHGDLAFDSYIVTEFVSGPTLTAWRASAAPSLEDAVAVTRRILRILRDCHGQGCVHRDVKPDNVILQDGDPGRACLLDFGLSYHKAAEPDFRTEDGQEVGNRFLRLPELSAGSVLKQDPRSDLSFAGGILFFLIVGSHPDVLQDAEGRLPHQRRPALAALQTAAGPRLARLVAFFDNAFEPVLAARFSNAGAMLDALDRLMEALTAIGSPDDDFAAIRGVIDTAAERRLIASIKTFGDAIGHFGPVFHAIRDELGAGFSLSHTAQRIDADVGTTNYIWSRTGSDPFLSTTCEATQAGDEVVVRLSGETVHRTPIASPDFGGQMASAIRTWVLARIRRALVDPDHLPVEAEFFRETAPHGRLAAAADAARLAGRQVLAFVYDPSQSERGQLAHGLRYFLENRRTRDTMNAAFVTALVPLAQIAEISAVLDDQSMERSRWVVLDADLHPFEQQVIHANGEGGESTMLALADRYPPETAS